MRAIAHTHMQIPHLFFESVIRLSFSKEPVTRPAPIQLFSSTLRCTCLIVRRCNLASILPFRHLVLLPRTSVVQVIFFHILKSVKSRILVRTTGTRERERVESSQSLLRRSRARPSYIPYTRVSYMWYESHNDFAIFEDTTTSAATRRGAVKPQSSNFSLPRCATVIYRRV